MRLTLAAAAELSEGLTPNVGSTAVWLTELAPLLPSVSWEEPGMSLGMAAFPGTLPPYWLLVTAMLGPKMWNLKHDFSKVLS